MTIFHPCTGFCDGASHQRKDTYRQSPYDTVVFVIQTTKGAGKWRVTAKDAAPATGKGNRPSGSGLVSVAESSKAADPEEAAEPSETVQVTAPPRCLLEEELRSCMAMCMPSSAAEARHKKRRGAADVAHWSHKAASKEEDKP